MNEFPYDTSYSPAIPVCEVTLLVPSSGLRLTLSAIIDTGADATIIPIPQLKKIGARRAYEARLRNQWGEARRVYLYVVDMKIGGFSLPGIYVVGDDRGDECVVGRNILNRLKMLLDGPQESVQLLDGLQQGGSVRAAVQP